MPESSFSPVEAFKDLLKQLLEDEFKSERINHYSIIRQQIEAFLWADAVSSLALSLCKELNTLISSFSTSSVSNQSLQIALWPKFHHFI